MKNVSRPGLFVVAMALAAFPFSLLRAADDATQKTIAPPENLVLDGIPPIPAGLVDEVGRYTESRAASFAAWHPTRPEMLILTRFADTNQVHQLTIPGGARTQLTFFPDRVLNATMEPTKGDYFILTKSAGGNEFNQNYRYDFTTGQITLLTDGKSRNSEPTWSTKGDRIAYTSTRRNGADTDIYLQMPNDRKSDRLLAEVKGGGWQVLDWSPDDRQLLVLEYVSINESYLWLFDTEKGERKEVTPRPADGAEKVSYGKALFAKSGNGIFVTTDRESEFQRLAYIDLANGKHVYFARNENFDVDEWDLSPDGKQIAYTLNENGVSTLHVFGVAPDRSFLTTAGSKEPGDILPGGVISGLKWHRDAKQSARRFQLKRRPLPLGCLFMVNRGGQRCPDPLDDERDGRDSRGAVCAAGIGEMEIVRRARDHRFPLRAGRKEIPRQTSPHHQHSRRSGSAVPPRLSRAQQLLHQRTRLRHSLPERARLGRLWEVIRPAR